MRMSLLKPAVFILGSAPWDFPVNLSGQAGAFLTTPKLA
jgi:hypothetical protein